jgi:hypothetical protein
MAGILLFLFQASWTETTQLDFKDGTYECNIYASQRDSGTVEFSSRWDLNNDGYMDIVITNEFSDDYIYWGSVTGYNPGNYTTYIADGGDAEAGDLDLDGFSELLLIRNSGAGVRIFRGSATGPNPGSYYDLSSSAWNEASYIADLNKDGYLDLIIHQYSSGQAGIYWGSVTGYSPGNMTYLPVNGGEHNIEVADFNRDNWLDILFIRGSGGSGRVYWGSSSGFNPTSYALLSYPSGNASGTSVADLNNDGWLDVILTSFGSTTQSYLYRGTAAGFVFWQSLSAGSCFGGSSVADLNRDGYLDILYTQGYGIDAQPIIYWGSATGYSESSKTFIGAPVDGSGTLIADFNLDDTLDILIDNYGYPPENSYILKGPNYSTQLASLPSGRDAHSRFREIGSVYHRKYFEDYLSSIYDAGGITNWGTIDWDDSLPPGSRIAMFVRSGNVPVPDSNWSGWDSLGKLGNIPDSLNGRYLQYRARLAYTQPSYLPYLYEVRIVSGPSLILEPDQSDSTLPAVAVDYPVSVINVEIGQDTVDLAYDHSTSWPVALLDSAGINPLVDHNGNTLVDVILNTNDTLPITVRVTPPAGTQGGAVDSLVLTGYSTTMPGLRDSVLIRTTIPRIVAILVDPDQADTVAAGNTATYGLLVINQGTMTDTVDLYYQHDQPWGIGLLDSTGTQPLADHNGNGFPDVAVNSGGTCVIILNVYTSSSALPGSIDSLILTGRSSRNPTVTDRAWITTVIGLVSTIVVNPDQTGIGYPGVETRYDLYAKKFGPGTDTIDLMIRQNIGWPVMLFDSTGTDTLIDHNQNGIPDVVAAPDDSVPILLGITPPGSAPLGVTDTLYLIGVSDILPGVRDSARLLTTIEATGNVIVFPDQSGNGPPGTWVYFPLTCRNNQNHSDTIDLRYRDRLTYTNQLRDSLGALLTDHNANGLVDIPGIPGFGGEANFRLQVYIPGNAPGGITDSIWLFGLSGADTLIRDSAQILLNVTTSIQVRIDPDRYDSTDAGDSLNFRLYVQNLGNSPDVIDLDIQGGAFSYSLRDLNGVLLTDTDSDGLVDVGQLPPFAGGESILVRVKVPSVPAGTIDTVSVRARSSLNPLISDQAQIRTKVLGGIYSLDIESDQVDRIEVGHSISYSLSVLLQANLADIVELEVYGARPDWKADLLDINNNPLTDNDGDGFLDLNLVTPQVLKPFYLRVTAPDHFIFEGQLDTIQCLDLVLRGHSCRQPGIRDSVRIRTILSPPFEVHNFRNPFHGQTRFIISLPKDGRITLEIYNRAGELVRRLIDNTRFGYGIHYWPWDGTNHDHKGLAPGTYIYVLEFTADDGERMVVKKKAIILK